MFHSNRYIFCYLKPIKLLPSYHTTCRANVIYLSSINYSTGKSSLNKITNKENTSQADFGKKNSDTFGNLKISLEKSKQDNVRVIRVKKFTPKKTNEANIFGKLSSQSPIWYPDIHEKPKIDNDQSDDSIMVRNISRKYRDPVEYTRRMKAFVQEKRLKDALDLFVEMKRNFVDPLKGHYTLMISACGKAGYTEMAFKLLRQMTDRKYKPSSATLTGLFNSCAECPYPEYGLKKAKYLKEKIQMKNWEMNQISYHAMIKAFGRCGDMQTAFQVVDEMSAAKIKIDSTTYNFLLMSCIENKESGFTYAIEVWRKMKKRSCDPSVFTFNLLLRSARDCDIGPEEISSLLIQHWSNYLKRPYGFKIKEITKKEPILQIECAGNVQSIDESDSKLVNEEDATFNSSEFSKEENFKQSQSEVAEMKNSDSSLFISSITQSVLGQRPEGNENVLDLGTIKTSSDRLAVLGGARGFLKDMEQEKVKPTIKTFTLILECLPPYLELEEELITLLDVYKVTPDTGFCNILMKRRIFRYEGVAAKQALQLLSKWSLCPDVITFGILASGSRYYNQAQKFLSDLDKLGFCPNIEIAGALLRNACVNFDFKYMESVLSLMKNNNIKPNERLLTRIDKTLKTAKKNVIHMEHGKDVDDFFKRKNFSQQYEEFCDFYENWLPTMKFENEEHLWSQYKTEIVEKNLDTEPCTISQIIK